MRKTREEEARTSASSAGSASATAPEKKAALPYDWATAAIFLLAALTYALTLRAGFLYDDIWTINENYFIKDLGNVWRFFGEEYFTSVPDNNRPVMVLSNMIDYQVYGLAPGGYHMQSVLWHCLCSVLVWRLGRRLFANRKLAFVAAALFAVHPIHTEAVAAINYREDLLVTFFLLATWILIAKRRAGGSVWLVPAACATLILGVFSKETALVFPLLLAVVDGFTAPRGKLGAHLWAQKGWYLGLGLLLLLVFVPFARAFPDESYTSVSTHAAPLSDRLFTFARIGADYMRQMVLPFGLSAEYTPRMTGAGDPANWLGGAALLAVAFGALAMRRRSLALAVGLAWFLVALLPTSNAISIFNPRADRYLYFPSVGFCFAAAWALTALGRSVAARTRATPDGPWSLRLQWAPAAIACALFAAISVHRVTVWRTPLTLWSRTVQDTPDSARAWSALAYARVRADDAQGALDAARRGLEISPDYGKLVMVLGIALAENQEYEEAAIQLERAVSLIGERDRARVHNNLGVVHRRRKRHDLAAESFRNAIELSPTDARFHRNLGESLEALGQIDAARQAYRRALDLAPRDSVARERLQALPAPE